MEFEVASRSVHSQVLDPEGKECDPEGDDLFRAAFMDNAKRFMAEVDILLPSIADNMIAHC